MDRFGIDRRLTVSAAETAAAFGDAEYVRGVSDLVDGADEGEVS
jgi:hypothetical protein